MIRPFAIAAALTALASPAFACRPLEEVLREYQSEFGETPRWMGNSTSTDADYTVLIIAGPDGNWTLFKVTRRGACQIDYGRDAETLRGSGV